MSQTALITLLAILLFTGGFFGGGSPSKDDAGRVPPPATSTTEAYGVIRANTVAVHAAPKSREVIAHLVRGDQVTILKETDGWYRIRMANGQEGYVNTFAVASGSTSIARPTSGKYQVVAYYVTDSRLPSLPSLRENLDVITTVIPWMWQVTPLGLVEDFSVSDVAGALHLAGTHGIKSHALIHNIGETQTGTVNFSGSMIHQVLADPTTRSRTIETIYRHLVNWGMNGVHVDFENVQPSDRQNLNQFLKELYERMKPAGIEVSIAVPAKTQENYVNAFSGAYDYATISRYVDAMMIMAYDEHWRGGPPGPVASIGWVERVVRYAISAGVPPEKIILGVPAYGYDWPPNGRGRAVTYRQAIEQASQHGAKIQWDDTAKVPYYRYAGGREVWFEDRSSLSHKLEIVKKYGLAGISLWRLGQEDPGIWSVIREQLR